MNLANIVWDEAIQVIDGRPYRVGRIFDDTSRAPARVKCDLDKLQELDNAGEPIDDAITLERLV